MHTDSGAHAKVTSGEPGMAAHGGAKAAEGAVEARPMTPPASAPDAGPERCGNSSGPAHPLITPTARLLLPAGAPEDAWLATRRAGVGGSDVAAILGLHPYKGPLHVWRDKHGQPSPVDEELVWWGNEMEPVIARRFARVTGFGLAPSPGTLQHVDRPWMRVNVDVLAEPEPGVIEPVEIKNRSQWQAAQWEDESPDDPALQAIWGMAVGGWGGAWTAACIGGNRLAYHHIDRDDDLIDHMVAFCGDWWERHVVGGEMPSPDGSKATTDLLAHLFDVEPDKAVEVDPIESYLLLQRHRELRAQLQAVQADLDEVANCLRAMVGDAEIAMVDGKPAFTWRQNGNLRSRDFAAAHPDLLQKHTKRVTAPDWDAIKAAHPEEHRRHRARVLRIPKEGPK